MRTSSSIVAAIFSLALAVAAAGQTRSVATALTPAEKQDLQRETRLIVDFLQNYHYSGKAFREISNDTMIARFADELDPTGQFLTQDDVAFVTRRFSRTFKSVYLYKGDLQPAFEIFDLYARRVEERLAWIDERMKRNFDLTTQERIDPSAEHPRNRREADAHWELALRELVLMERMFGRSPPDTREAITRTFDRVRQRLASIDASAVRERFLDAIIRSFDPHSGYMSADTTREFSIDMGDSLGGIGIEFRKLDGECVVTGIHPGGPADISGRIEVGDLLTGFSEGDSPRLELKGRTLNEIVSLIRGEAGTDVRVFYRRANESEIREQVLTRAVVALPERRARGAITQVPDEQGLTRPIGWIALPAFYGSGAGDDGESATRDVAELLKTMMAAGVEGVVMDLRRNPGGALLEAVGLSGLFLPEGSRVIYSRGSAGEPEERTTEPGEIRYDGPLLVLTSGASASASEVFAGALQLHRRAVIIGAQTSFGKGTVQQYIDLKQLPGAGASSTWGTLKLTAQHYYLPNGGPVQGKGITADLVLPLRPVPGETSRPGSLPPETLTSAAVFSPALLSGATVSDGLLEHLRVSLERNLRELPEWALWNDERRLYDELQREEERSLNLEERLAEQRESEVRFATVLQQRSRLTHETAFVARRVDSEDVQAALAAHQKSLRDRMGEDGQARGLVWRDEWFAVRNAVDGWQDLRLSDLEFRRYHGHAGELAAAVSGATGREHSADAVQLLLRDLSLRTWDEAPLGEVLVRHLGPTSGDAFVDAVAALLQRIVTIDADLARDLPALDIPLREGLRAAAAWAERLAPAAGNSDSEHEISTSFIQASIPTP